MRNELNIPPTNEGETDPTPTQALNDNERVTLVNELLSETREYDRAILNHKDLPDDGLDSEINNGEEFESLVRVELARLVTKIRQLAEADAGALHHSAHSTTPTSRGDAQRAFQSPTFEVPPVSQDAFSLAAVTSRSTRELDIAPEKFGGDRLKCKQFRTQFECWVGRQSTSTLRERLMVLKKYVTGDPKALIDPLDLTDANYKVAWSLLEANFSRIDTERERIIAELRNPQPRVSSPYDAANLRKLLTMVQRNTQSLEAMGLPLSATAPFLKSALEAALPAKTRQDFRDALRLDERFSSLSLDVITGSQQQASLSDSMTAELQKHIEFLQRYVNDLEDSRFITNVVNPSSSRPNETRGNPKKVDPSNKAFIPIHRCWCQSRQWPSQELPPATVPLLPDSRAQFIEVLRGHRLRAEVRNLKRTETVPQVLPAQSRLSIRL